MLNINDVPSHSIIIAPNQLHNHLYELLSTHKASLCTKVLTLELFLSTLAPHSMDPKEIILFKYKAAIAPLLSSIPNFKAIASTPSFLKECYDCISNLKLYNITPSELRLKYFQDQQLKLIIETLYPIQIPADCYFNALLQLKSRDCSHIYIIDSFINHQQSLVLSKLLSNNAHLISTNQTLTCKHFMHANQIRQEVTAIAQYIITNKIKATACTIQICDHNYLPFINDVFRRYNIPFNHNNTDYTIYHAYQNLIAYALNPNNTNLIKIIDLDLFNIPNISKLKTYIKLFDLNINQVFNHVANTPKSILFNEYDYDYLTSLETAAEAQRLSLIEHLQPLLINDSLINKLTAIHQIIIFSYPNNPKHFKAIKTIHTFLKNTLPYLQDNSDIMFMLSIMPIPNLNTEKYDNAIEISILDAPIPSKEYGFIIGANESNFIAFKSQTGIFDEEYMSTLTKFPSLQERYDLYLHQIKKVMNNSPNLIVSYARNTLDGKTNEASIYLENYFKVKSQAFKLVENEYKYNPTLKIDPSNVSQLLLDKEVFNTSLSALERYAGCPFSYYAQDILKLRINEALSLDSAHLGILLHKVLEQLVSEYAKTYSQGNKSKDIEKIIDSAFKPFYCLYPQNTYLYDTIKQSLYGQLSLTLNRLNEFELHSLYTPYKLEYECNSRLENSKSATPINIKGRIDRIDKHNEDHIIIDYKSSDKTFDKKKLFKGTQLQLPTYASLLQSQNSIKIAGFYYMTLRNKNIVQIASQYQNKNKEVAYLGIEDTKLESIKKQRITGGQLKPNDEALDSSGTHVVGMRMNKTGLTNSYYSSEELKKFVTQIIDEITADILAGKIESTPNEASCKYCKYHALCRNNHNYIDKKEYFDSDLLKKIKEGIPYE